jgi:hypothetical protein
VWNLAPHYAIYYVILFLATKPPTGLGIPNITNIPNHETPSTQTSAATTQEGLQQLHQSKGAL